MARVVCALRCCSLILERNSPPGGRLRRLQGDVCHRHHQRDRLLGNCSGVALPPASMPSWAHARRKFVGQHKISGSPIALEAIERVAVLYRIKAERLRIVARLLRPPPNARAGGALRSNPSHRLTKLPVVPTTHLVTCARRRPRYGGRLFSASEAKAMTAEGRHAHRRRHRRFGHAIQPLRDTNQASRRRISRNQGIQNGLASTR